MYHGLHWMKNLFTNFHISKSPFVSIKRKEKKKKKSPFGNGNEYLKLVMGAKNENGLKMTAVWWFQTLFPEILS